MGPFDTVVLAKVVESLDQPSSHLLQTYFPLVQTSESEEIYFDILNDKPRITPFVHPTRAGEIVDGLGYTTKSFKPAYAKDKRIFKPNAALRRNAGETIGGSLTPSQRMEANIRVTLEDQLKMLTRRENVMASEALRLGTVTVTGDGYPQVVVNFGRDASLIKTLAGASRWGQAGIKPLDNLETWIGEIQTLSGAVSADITMDPLAFRLFRADADVQKLLDIRRGTNNTLSAEPVVRGQGEDKARYVGSIGVMNFWVYQDTYVDDNGTTQKMIPDNTVIIGGGGLEGTRGYGVILDEQANISAQRYFVKSWLEQDPALRIMLLQSAPLVFPYRANASLCATVN